MIYNLSLGHIEQNLIVFKLQETQKRFSQTKKFVGPYSHKDKDYCIQSNFWKFYLIKTGFTLGESVYLVKMFKLFKLEQMFFDVESVDIVGRCTTSYLLAGLACL
jgi:hypothetical protein